MFDIAATVTAWLDGNEDVFVARVLSASGLAGREAAPVAAWTDAGGGPVGSPLAARAQGSTGRVEVTVSEDDAPGAGLACGGRATVLVQRATELPDGFWSAFRRGEPVALVDPVDPAATSPAEADDPAGAAGVTDGAVSGGWTTRAYDATGVPEEFARVFGRGVSQVAEIEGSYVTTYWPRTRLLVVGGGPVASALLAQADLLGWSAVVAEDTATALDLLRGYGGADGVVVLSHDREVDGPVLAAAVASPVGYVGAMGSRHTQAARATWFAEHGVTERLDRIHGPAGLDVGGFGPAEIALSIAAEIVAVRSGH